MYQRKEMTSRKSGPSKLLMHHNKIQYRIILLLLFQKETLLKEN